MPILSGNTWDLVLLAIAGYVAVIALVRMMLAERNRLAQDLDQQIESERARLTAEKRRAKKTRGQGQDDRGRRAA